MRSPDPLEPIDRSPAKSRRDLRPLTDAQIGTGLQAYMMASDAERLYWATGQNPEGTLQRGGWSPGEVARRFNETIGQPREPDIAAVRRLAEVARDAESVTYVSPDGAFLYRVFVPFTDSEGQIAIGYTVEFRDGTRLLVPGTLTDLLERLHVLGAVGGTPTEIAGLTSTGEFVTKQPAGYPLPGSVPFVVEAQRTALQVVRLGSAANNESDYVTEVDGEPYLLSDVGAPGALTVDRFGRERLCDPMVGRIPDALIGQIPLLRQALHEARGQLSNSEDRAYTGF